MPSGAFRSSTFDQGFAIQDHTGGICVSVPDNPGFDSFVEQFKPQGGIDYSMIDMLAVTYAMWMHWSETHVHRATSARLVPLSKREKEAAGEQSHEWIVPRVYEQQAIEQAAQLADRWRRAYQATLRQMRDWRRYNTPVTINNPRQVNIAADGGQQVNRQARERDES